MRGFYWQISLFLAPCGNRQVRSPCRRYRHFGDANPHSFRRRIKLPLRNKPSLMLARLGCPYVDWPQRVT
jgi:hypothetical protein